jgi:tRNAThr (cytosine32-N3)-methyltransferase
MFGGTKSTSTTPPPLDSLSLEDTASTSTPPTTAPTIATTATSPTPLISPYRFELLQLGVDRRLLLNRKKMLRMYRVWLQVRL